jgi:hypothetical protein
MSKPLTEGQKWMISFMSALLFVLLAAPFMFKLTGGLLSKVGLRTEQGGCPNWYGLIVHAVLFAVLIRVLMLVPLIGNEGYKSTTYNFQRGYTGLANPGSMAKCNAAYLVAEREGCGDCVHAAQTCMTHPFSSECKTAIKQCQDGCHKSAVANMTTRNCDIYGHMDYYPYAGGC